MKKILFPVFLLIILIELPLSGQNIEKGPITLVVHGGAGTITRKNLTEEQEKSYRDKLTEAINKGYSILENGGSALDAVTSTIIILENSPLFNAGKGAVFTHEGENEMDASIMDGSSLQAGAVTGLKVVKNPILAAKAVMDESSHVMLSGEGAAIFAEEAGLEIVDPKYFFTERRFESLKKALEEESGESFHEAELMDHKFGTVGVVALDRRGDLAAGTSTGGMTNKKFGRIGDSPIIGAGTYADNNSCAVSSTGHGEYFIRKVVAYDIAAKVKYLKLGVEEAAREVVLHELGEMGGTGGVICLDKKGNFAMVFNTEGMYRGYKQKGKKLEVLIYK